MNDSNPCSFVVAVISGVLRNRTKIIRVVGRDLTGYGGIIGVIIALESVKLGSKVGSLSVGMLVLVIFRDNRLLFGAVIGILRLCLEGLNRIISFLFMNLMVVEGRLDVRIRVAVVGVIIMVVL